MMTEQEKQVLADRIQSVQERIARAAERTGRSPDDIILVAASKMNDAERVRAAIAAGIRVCGENRVQELCDKYDALEREKTDVQFIRHLQTNKVKYLIGKVSMIQSVDSMKLAQEISRFSRAAKGWKREHASKPF